MPFIIPVQSRNRGVLDTDTTPILSNVPRNLLLAPYFTVVRQLSSIFFLMFGYCNGLTLFCLPVP